MKAGGICQVCGQIAYKVCKECERIRGDGNRVYCCFKHQKEDGKAVKDNLVSCSIDLHDDDLFGLTLNDRRKFFGDNKNGFKKATKTEMKKNKDHIAKLKLKKMRDDLKNEEG